MGGNSMGSNSAPGGSSMRSNAPSGPPGNFGGPNASQSASNPSVRPGGTSSYGNSMGSNSAPGGNSMRSNAVSGQSAPYEGTTGYLNPKNRKWPSFDNSRGSTPSDAANASFDPSQYEGTTGYLNGRTHSTVYQDNFCEDSAARRRTHNHEGPFGKSPYENLHTG